MMGLCAGMSLAVVLDQFVFRYGDDGFKIESLDMWKASAISFTCFALSMAFCAIVIIILIQL